MNCPVCRDAFEPDPVSSKAPCASTCSHLICKGCALEIKLREFEKRYKVRNIRCPQCRKLSIFVDPPTVNYGAIDLIIALSGHRAVQRREGGQGQQVEDGVETSVVSTNNSKENEKRLDEHCIECNDKEDDSKAKEEEKVQEEQVEEPRRSKRVKVANANHGILNSKQKFVTNSNPRIPTHFCSKWKLKRHVDNERVKLEAIAVCSKCLKKEKRNDTDQILLCDGCDLEIHTSCAGFNMLPEGDWLCRNCLKVLKARNDFALSPLKELDSDTVALAVRASISLREAIAKRKSVALNRMKENHRVLKRDLQKRTSNLENERLLLKNVVSIEGQRYDASRDQILARHGITDWGLSGGSSWIVPDHGTSTRVNRQNPEWERFHRKLLHCIRALDREREPLRCAENGLEELENKLREAEAEEDKRLRFDEKENRSFLLEFARLEGGERLDFESIKHCSARLEDVPVFLGVVKVEYSDIQILNMLREPIELVLMVPVSQLERMDYYLFGTSELFCSDRNDGLPMDFSHTTSMRKAQRHLISMLLRDPRNESLQTSQPIVPASVELRGSSQDSVHTISKYFDLSELVRDCNYPIVNKPRAPTPKILAAKGLVLRDYQQASLQWMIDKENSTTELGFAGEIWSRMRSLDGKCEFFYCQLTGSINRNLFDFRSDGCQGGVAKYCGQFPSGGILGEEMGLGKMVISIALAVASPPPLHNRVLPREYIAEIDHPAYRPPPSIAEFTRSSNAKKAKVLLSNASIVVAPMALCPQWQSEIESYAPWMSIMPLCDGVNPTLEEMASSDIIVASTFLFQTSAGLIVSHTQNEIDHSNYTSRST